MNDDAIRHWLEHEVDYFYDDYGDHFVIRTDHLDNDTLGEIAHCHGAVVMEENGFRVEDNSQDLIDQL